MKGMLLDRERSVAATAAMVGYTFGGESPEVQSRIAGKAIRELEGMLEAVEESGEIVVREKGSGRPVAEAVRDYMNRPEQQYMLVPKSRGGSGTDGTGR